ncbi:hypothetical protein ACFX1R_002871 [Malus domestica]
MVVSISKERICSSIWAVARQHNLPPHPILLALASSANIGFAATPIDNPQNLVIAIRSCGLSSSGTCSGGDVSSRRFSPGTLCTEIGCPIHS